MNFDASSAVRFRSSSSSPHDVIKATPFNRNVHHPRLLTEAASGSLEPPPTGRLRRAYLHLSHSMAPFAPSWTQRLRFAGITRMNLWHFAACFNGLCLRTAAQSSAAQSLVLALAGGAAASLITLTGGTLMKFLPARDFPISLSVQIDQTVLLRLASSVVVLLPPLQPEGANRTFQLCANRTLSFCGDTLSECSTAAGFPR